MITLNYFIDSCDICFIQEHWLSNALLHKIGEISQDFVCTSVSGMVDSSILSGRFFTEDIYPYLLLLYIHAQIVFVL